MWNLLSVFVSFVLVDRFGRRPLMLIAMGTMSAALVTMGILFHVFPLGTNGVVCLAMIMVRVSVSMFRLIRPYIHTIGTVYMSIVLSNHCLNIRIYKYIYIHICMYCS